MSRELRYERLIQASPARVFDLFTSPAGQLDPRPTSFFSGRRMSERWRRRPTRGSACGHPPPKNARAADGITFLDCGPAEAVRIALAAVGGKNLEVFPPLSNCRGRPVQAGGRHD